MAQQKNLQMHKILVVVAFGLKNNMNTVGIKNKIVRDEWLKKILSQIPSGNKILDAGAGELRYKKFCSHLNYVSQDFAQYDGVGDEVGLHTKQWDNSKLDIISDIINIPVKNESFDAVMCVEVFEHLPEPIKAIKEFFRILKPGGKLILTTPFCSLTHFAPYYFASGYSKYWHKEILEKNNFEINELSFNGNYFDYLAQEIRRIPSIEKKYTNQTLSTQILFRVTTKIQLYLLKKLSQNNKNSEELLSFGLHVLATKKLI